MQTTSSGSLANEDERTRFVFPEFEINLLYVNRKIKQAYTKECLDHNKIHCNKANNHKEIFQF